MELKRIHASRTSCTGGLKKARDLTIYQHLRNEDSDKVVRMEFQENPIPTIRIAFIEILHILVTKMISFKIT